MIVLPTFAGLKATYNVLDLKITKKKGSGKEVHPKNYQNSIGGGRGDTSMQ